jgi:xanthine dehydrogenase accessory factor
MLGLPNNKDLTIHGSLVLSQFTICIKGAGEMASAVAWRLHRCGLRRILMLEKPRPLAVRRRVCFCEAVYHGRQQVEGLTARCVPDEHGIDLVWGEGQIALLVDPDWRILANRHWDVVVDAILAKRNLGTTLGEAPLVIGLGPGFEAGKDVHRVIETLRGHHLGRVIEQGAAAANTGIPAAMGGVSRKRVLRAPCAGLFQGLAAIGDQVRAGQTVARVDGRDVGASIDGLLRGLIKNETPVTAGLKIGDIDPRGDAGYCGTISDKARAVAGGVLEAVLSKYNCLPVSRSAG